MYTKENGVWRSLVARSAGGREVAGSNPVTPINKEVVIKKSVLILALPVQYRFFVGRIDKYK